MSNRLSLPRWLIPVGRAFYAIGLIGIGIQHFIFRDFIPVIVPLWPAWIPARPLWACVMGAALIAAGAAILFHLRARTVAAIAGLALLILVILDDIPSQLMAYPAHLGVWTNTFKALTLCGGAWIVAGSLIAGSFVSGSLVAGSLNNGTPGLPNWLEATMPLGRFFLPITVVVFGIDHFLYTPFVATLVPSWVPGGAIFWTYFAGIALIAAGLAMLIRILPQLASLLLGIMIFLWLLMLHIPRAIADPHSGNGNEWTSVFEALAFSGIAFLLAALPTSSRFSIAHTKEQIQSEPLETSRPHP